MQVVKRRRIYSSNSTNIGNSTSNSSNGTNSTVEIACSFLEAPRSSGSVLIVLITVPAL